MHVPLFPFSKMINLSVPDTIDERTINKKKLTPFTIQVWFCFFFLFFLFWLHLCSKIIL